MESFDRDFRLALKDLTLGRFQELTDRDLEDLSHRIAYVNTYRRWPDRREYRVKLYGGAQANRFELRRITQVGLSYVDICLDMPPRGGAVNVQLLDGDVIYKKRVGELYGDDYYIFVYRGHQLDILTAPLEDHCPECRYNTVTRFVSGEDRLWVQDMLDKLSDDDFHCQGLRIELIDWLKSRISKEDKFRAEQK